jgi:hypothetical protein
VPGLSQAELGLPRQYCDHDRPVLSGERATRLVTREGDSTSNELLFVVIKGMPGMGGEGGRSQPEQNTKERINNSLNAGPLSRHCRLKLSRVTESELSMTRTSL